MHMLLREEERGRKRRMRKRGEEGGKGGVHVIAEALATEASHLRGDRDQRAGERGVCFCTHNTTQHNTTQRSKTHHTAMQHRTKTSDCKRLQTTKHDAENAMQHNAST